MFAQRRCRSDNNQRSIIADLRQLGAVVKPVSMYGIGFDLLVGYRGQLWAVEVKHADTREHLTDNERKTADTLPAYIVIDSAEDFLRQADDAHRSAIRTLCHGSDFGVLLTFGHGKRGFDLYGKDTDNQRRAMRLKDKILTYKKLFEKI